MVTFCLQQTGFNSGGSYQEKVWRNSAEEETINFEGKYFIIFLSMQRTQIPICSPFECYKHP